MQKHKTHIQEYFKQWYEIKGRALRKEKNYPKRNKRLYEMYLDRKKKHLSVEAIAKMFQISLSEARKIIREEKKSLYVKSKSQGV